MCLTIGEGDLRDVAIEHDDLLDDDNLNTGILHQLDIRTPYVYTDPDVLPVESCPKGLVARLY